ncbi:MAG: helix-turn-helix domain-containing protein [Burkholderiales bacterium]|nr:helix-turn-helix domain-containing protein [Burkholderiales bacterium]
MAVASLQRRLGSLVHDQRQQLGLTKTALARKAGVSRPTVIAAEAGNGVSSQNLLAVMAALGLTFAKQPAQVASPRPRLKDVMRAERERQAMLHAARATPAAALSHTVRVTTHSVGVLGVTASSDHRPRLKDVMAAERARQVGRQKGAA